MTHSQQSISFYTIFIFLILFRLGASAQAIKTYDKVEIQTLYINAKDSMVRFQVLSDNKNNKYLPSLTYFWYKSNTILKTVGGADGKLLNGEYVCFYADNNLKEKGKFNKGLKDEIWITWSSDGKKREQVSWKKGLLHGAHLMFDKDGHIQTTEKYKNGTLQLEKKKKVKSSVAKEPKTKEIKHIEKPVPVKPSSQKK